ncbi:anaphase-promoting complex subunit 7-like [Paramacrobiotus metropolitanus]|uniref:anaphase-promoting complex subunit 7-like n=1 Tax=Paramacrobiotus metropolitanus TaxID=2943436 RepID=UPI002445F1D5|nr:anaphase-promoting complex subunit 7-like [Paramacrobiotus metropolitanus]XP_055332652.1 anaphase-promoting complex subunit 7-like [Paramacrobiotus metropolitanus]XP_055332661.1 anaphase-promoting complex subunit 7-like [Paramacrobiotus metropolitanus]XP_055332669.1 anaphase-promoting complex subunit 7-like [Paramacrobiotus metropolitanus]
MTTTANNCGTVTLYQQFKTLHEEELFDSLVDLGDFLLTSDCRPRNPQAQRDLFRGPREEFRSIVLYAHALLQEHRYRQAIDVYGRACAMLYHTHPPPGSAGKLGGRSLSGPRVETPAGTTGFERIFTEDDIKYRLAQAYVFVDDPDEALSVLDTIPPANRSAKVNVMMVKLNPARQAYALDKMKQVVRQAPMALRVLKMWFACSGKMVELNANLGKNVAEEKVAQLLNKLVHCHAYIATGNYYYAYQAACALLEEPILSHNPILMTIQAKCQNSLGNQEQAGKILSSIDHTHANFFQDMDEYAAVLYDQNDVSGLQKLSERLVKCANLSPEAWTCKGYTALARKDFASAVRYAEHATNLDDTHYRAHVLRGLVYYKKEDFFAAQRSFQRAFDLSPTCLDAHKYRIEIYQKKYGEKESITAAADMYRLCKKNPRCVQIYAECYINFGYRLREVATTLEKHLKSYPRDRKSALLLASAYEKLKVPDRSVEVLKKQMMYGSSKEIHQFLARLYNSLNNDEKEQEHTNLADTFPVAGLDPRADSPMPGPSNGFRSSSPGSPRLPSPNEDDGPNEDSEAEEEDDEESFME